jgi:putative cardiolipin synthase
VFRPIFYSKISTLILVLLACAGCTHVPFDVQRDVTSAADVPDFRKMHDAAMAIEKANGGLNSIAPLPDGNDALGLRLRMIEEAQHSLDLQYFLIKPDHAGALISSKLLEAADRGVRVRFLLDDAFTTARDEQLSLIDHHPNIEIRIFNPLSRNTAGAMNYVLDFQRVNRRMHNKSFVADNAMAIIGGRNIADEYFQIDTSSVFADFEMVVVGPAVRDIAATFDVFWNDQASVPISALVAKRNAQEFDSFKIQTAVLSSKAAVEIYDRAVNSTYLKDLQAGRIDIQRAEVRVVTDRPEKTRVPVKGGKRVVGEALYQAMARAQKEVIVITPYFVPEDYGARFFEQLAQSGVRVRIVTNSLSATNHAYVHGGYYRHRQSLLAAGVELYEVRADAPRIMGLVDGGSDIKLTMHTKAAVIDRDYVFVGSMNIDPRSIKINTELGLFFDMKGVEPNWLDDVQASIVDFTFRLHLDDDGDVEWVYSGTVQEETFNSEPGASGWSKFVAWMARVLPIEGQL